jgi:hypothetical protein
MRKANFSLCFFQHRAMKTYQRVKVFQASLTYALLGGQLLLSCYKRDLQYITTIQEKIITYVN